MNNNIEEKEKEEEYINNRMIYANYITRNGRTTLNMAALTIREEPLYSALYVRKDENDDIILERDDKSGGVKREVKGLCAKGVKNSQHVLNMRGFVTNPGTYEFYRTGKGYRLHPVEIREIRPTGYETWSTTEYIAPKKTGVYKNSVNIGVKNLRKLLNGRTPETACLIIEEFYRPHAYIRVTCRSKTDMPENLTGLPGSTIENLTEAKSFIRSISAEQGCITPSRYFKEETGLCHGDKMTFEFENDALIIKVAPQKCEICSRMVDRRYETMYKLRVCKDCSTAVKMLGRKTEAEGANFKKISEELAELEPELALLCDQLNTDVKEEK